MADRAGFLAFLRGQMGCSSATLPDSDPSIDYAFNTAVILCDGFILATQNQAILDMMIYNLSGHYLMVFGPASAFGALQKEYGLNVLGILNSAGDQGTSGGFSIPGWVTDAGPLESEIGKTPYGRQFLMLSRSLSHAVFVA